MAGNEHYSAAYDAPASTAHKLIGTLNVLFASVLLLCGACSGVSLLAQVAMAPVSQKMQTDMQKAMAAQEMQKRQVKIDNLKEQEIAADTDEEKARLAAERLALEQKPIHEVPMADMMGAYHEPKLVGYLIGDSVSGIVVNVLLFASGIGLLMSKSWARRLGIWVAALKIVRLVAVYGFLAIFVAPVFSQKMGEAAAKMAENANPGQGGGPAMPNFGETLATFYAIFLSTFAVTMIIFGAIYPIIMLCVLTRPGVKAACGEIVTASPAEAT